MGHYLLSAEAAFSASHTLPGVQQCDQLHGLNWRVRLTVRVDEDGLGREGMGVDFRVIERALKKTVDQFDHQYLNDLEPFKDHAPSAERVAQIVSRSATDTLRDAAPNASVHTVEVWELPQYRVVYQP